MQNNNNLRGGLSQYWGKSLLCDLAGCNPELIKSHDHIEQFVHDLVLLLDMKAYGLPQIIHFGSEDKKGYTLVQLIETSSITGHFSEDKNTAYIDIFSCKNYNRIHVGNFVKSRFEAKSIYTRVALRK